MGVNKDSLPSLAEAWYYEVFGAGRVTFGLSKLPTQENEMFNKGIIKILTAVLQHAFPDDKYEDGCIKSYKAQDDGENNYVRLTVTMQNGRVEAFRIGISKE